MTCTRHGGNESYTLCKYCDAETVERHSATNGERHIHRCMSCGKRWYCPHPPSDCKAGESAFPSIAVRGPDGPTIFHHDCQVKR